MKPYIIAFLLFQFLLPGVLLSAPTRIYLMIFKSSEQDKEKAASFRRSLQSAISLDGKYSLIDEDTIRNFQEKLKNSNF